MSEIKLRDYFAGQALQGLIAHFGMKYEVDGDGHSNKAYLIADSMIKKRAKNNHIESIKEVPIDNTLGKWNGIKYRKGYKFLDNLFNECLVSDFTINPQTKEVHYQTTVGEFTEREIDELS